ncbi:CU044_2847 family protein [Streptomyces sp. NRRL WC-3742]|uniref:CU044_2847 family protein n=1 Tax=Streptomyces sp. NRRL WC-3742 TaxID=1463934 RepID=UPI0004C57D3A|nr:CU044_2847 family protein [Streptomyces sp. NRRL WC-3742]
MDSLVEFRTESGANVVVEVDDEGPGLELVARGDGGAVTRVGRTFEQALEGIHSAAESTLRVFRDGRLKPDSVEIEFGVKLTTEAGAVIARSSLEGHLVVKLSWTPSPEDRPDGRGSEGLGSEGPGSEGPGSDGPGSDGHGSDDEGR